MAGFIRKIFNRGEADCAEVRRLASDYLEDDLPPPKLSAVLSHLSKCGPCRAFVDTLASTIRLLSRFPRVTPPASFKQSILDRARREDQGRRG